jgi:outer membrane protein
VALYEQSEDQLKSVEMTVFAAVTEAYFNVLLTNITAVQFEEELTALETQLQEASALYDKGFLPITQVLETQTRVDTVRADLIAARGQAAVAKERLMSLLGQRGIDPIPVTENLLLPTDIHSGDLAAELGVANSPDVAAALDMLNAAREAVSRERGTWLPEVDLVVSQQYSDVGFDNLSSPPRTTESIAIAVNFPLLEGGSGSARLRGAWADFYGAQQELEAAKRDADMRARSAWVEYESAQQRLVAAKQALKTASVTVEAARKAVKAGTSRVTEVLLALARKTLTQRDYNAARFQYAMSWLELELSTGSHPDRLAPRLSAALIDNSL